MGGATLRKSLIQFSVGGWGCVPSLLFDLRPNYGGDNKDNGDLLQKVPGIHCYTQCPQPCSRPLLTQASTKIPEHSQASLVQSLVGSLLLFPGSWCTQGSVCALKESVSQSFRLRLKKVGKTTRPFRYDLNQIPYNYTVEVRNRFKGLDLIGAVRAQEG